MDQVTGTETIAVEPKPAEETARDEGVPKEIAPDGIAPVEPATGRWSRIRPSPIQLGLILLLLAIAAFSAYLGIGIRHDAYHAGDGMHWGDYTNAFTYGASANRNGLFDLYERMHNQDLTDGTPTTMDYPPLRLAVMSIWASWGARNMPGAAVAWYDDSYDITRPMLYFNTFTEGISALLVFLLIRLMLQRQDVKHEDTKHEELKDENRRRPGSSSFSLQLSSFLPMAGALLFWFNPAVIWSGHAWPQWDVWVFPFFLGALLLACVEWWFPAGCLIAIAACLKGQILLVAPFFLLWPLFRLQFSAAFRFVAGFVLAFGVVIFPWLRPTQTAVLWYCLTLAALGLMAPIILKWKLDWRWLAGLALAAVLVAWPWGSTASLGYLLLVPALLGAMALARFLPPRLLPHVFALAIGIVIFLIIPLRDGKTFWFEKGFEYGSQKFMIMALPGTNNLPSILERNFRWGSDPQVIFVHLPILGDVMVRNFMLGLYAISLVLSGIAAAIQSKRNDPRLLVAAIAPWICSFALLTQLNNRYLVWAAGLSALLPAVGLGMTLLGIIVSLIAWQGMAQIMVSHRGATDSMTTFVVAVQTQLGWMVLLAAAVYLYVALAPRKNRSRTA